MAICGVGGKDNFKKFFEKQLKDMITLTGDFDKIAVVTDRDDKSIKSIEEALFLRKWMFKKATLSKNTCHANYLMALVSAK